MSGRARAPQRLVAVCTFFALALTSFAADPAITVSAQQRYPWNGLVDINFTITGTSGTKYDTSFTAKDMVGNTNIAMQTIRKADGTAAAATEQLLPGTYNWVWDAATDLPKDFKCDHVTVTGTADISAFPYSVKFNANGGSGTMANESFTYGTAKALTANAFTRTGYTFQGWATSAGGAKAYNDKQVVSNLTTTVGAVVSLYAVWGGHGKVQLWAGGPYWATTNIGADNPEDYGYYFWWGDTVGYKREGNAWVATDGSSSNFAFDLENSPTYNKSGETLQSEGWITEDNVLSPEHDAAQVQWGGGWRMPTQRELYDLNKTYCDWTWTSRNGINGYEVRGRGDYASSSIFLPCTGYGYGTSITSTDSGCYWSSGRGAVWNASWGLSFNSATPYSYMYNSHYHGQAIRPVHSFSN